MNKAEYFSTITLKLVQSCLHSIKINKQTKCSCVHFSIFGEWLNERIGKFDNWGTVLTTLVFIYKEFIGMLQISMINIYIWQILFPINLSDEPFSFKLAPYHIQITFCFEDLMHEPCADHLSHWVSACPCSCLSKL